MKVNLRVFFSAFILTIVSSAIFFVALSEPAVTHSASGISASEREDAYRANNLGVAQLEQFNHQKGAELFRRALTLDPQLKLAQINLAIALFNAQEIDAANAAALAALESSPDAPQPHYILGMIARNQNRANEAVAHFQKVLTTDPTDVGANVNLGQIYIQQRNYAEAAKILRRALDAEPYNSTAMYNLATVLLRTEARAEGQQLMARFQQLRESGAATNIGQNYLEQGRYAEAVVSTGAESGLVDKTAPKPVFQNANVGLPDAASTSNPKNIVKSADASSPRAAAALFDFDNDGDADLAQAASASQIRLYRNQNGEFTNATPAAGDLGKPLELQSAGIVAGDYDNDNFADLLIFGSGQTTLFRNDGKGGFLNATKDAKLPASSTKSIAGAFLDADHDGDLDIFLGGYGDEKKKPDELAANRLWRNNGDGTFTDVSEIAKINLPSRAVAVVPTDYDNRRDIDLLVLSPGANPRLLRNLRNGTFGDVAAEVGLNVSKNWTCAAVGDYNKDTFVDFFFGESGGAGVFAVSDGRGKFALKNAPAGTENAESAQFLDFDNDGLLDLLVSNEKGFAVARNLGDQWSQADSSVFKIKTGENNALAGARRMLSGDTDGDGDVDLLTFAKNGSLHFLRNVGGEKNNAEIVRLQGRVSNRTGVGAKIDLRSGSLAQKLESYAASPMPAPSQIHFGLGKRERPDAVRVVWTSGVVQAEVDFPEKTSTAKNYAPLKIEELDRKPSSCPYLYAWNGEKFEFVTDFLGGGEMGNWAQAGVYHYPDSDEFVRITSDQLKPKNGKYEIRVTNELEEVLFLDYLKLVAVEHDASAEVYPNEGLGIAAAGKRVLYTTAGERAPLAAVDSDGKSVLPQIEKLDRVFYDRFKSQNIRGYAETHNLTLRLDDKKGFEGRTLLLLTGWTDYAYSSDNLAASQSGRALSMPKLQVKNKRGEWQTVIDSIGISIGRPQTIVADLTGKFLTDSREVRIVTNFKTFWDKIAVDTSEQKGVKSVELKPAQTDLRERGFSEEIKFGAMIAANYDRVLNDGRWKYFSGNFTRTGDVQPLLNETDDVFVISKTGDELILSFDALPAPPPNKKYTFLLYVDGYSKEMDINSGSPDAVTPLPFKKMSAYPYAETERFPMTEDKRRLYDEYTTRRVKGFLPRIEAHLLK